MTTQALPRPKSGTELADRLARSAAVIEEIGTGAVDESCWLAKRRATCKARVSRIPFSELDGWSFAPDTGNLQHRSGRFFTVEGLHVDQPQERWQPTAHWQQPIIVQPEVGILGILAKEFDGILHFLMQTKMEPGNPGLIQLSPTVQATHSNYTKAHGGAAVKYLEYFTDPTRGQIITDVLQSEHGSWFYRKRNRNVIVETDEDVLVDDDFRWFTIGKLGALLHLDNVVNMDARTVLASAPMPYQEYGALSSDFELLAWFTRERTRRHFRADRMPLRQVDGWHRDAASIHRDDHRFFEVVAVAVEGADREVNSWTQPLFEPVGTGIVGFAYRIFNGTPHVLVHARAEGGFLDPVELGPTVQCIPANYAQLPASQRPLFLDLMLDGTQARVRYCAVHSEEGGRFLNAESCYLIVETDESTTPRRPPEGYHWVTPGQLTWLAGHSGYVNVQARSLLAALATRAA